MSSAAEITRLKESVLALIEKVERLEKVATGHEVICPRCNGGGRISGEYQDGQWRYNFEGECPLCNGTKTIMEWT